MISYRQLVSLVFVWMLLLSPISLMAIEDGMSRAYRVVLAPRHTTILSAEIASSVRSISKEMGDRFNSGEVLIQLDDRLFKAKRNKARFLLERAQEQLSAKQQLYDDNVASAFELKDAEASEAVAELDMETADKELASCYIRSPYQGHVDKLLVNEHEIVQPGQPLIEIVDDKTLLAKLLIPSSYFNKIQQGQTLMIDIKETGSQAQAIVTHIGAVIDPASSMFKIYAEVNNHEGKFRSGMTGMTRIGQ
ncbi:Uncharacterized protein SCG7109_AV_00040 [Chlamydiales bacterium SCGC AG-110-M15]|nr:Uncharacterized protein SCG7109_AV_00040 [Chlamydiales bacterium SCGC AG-110-M15]